MAARAKDNGMVRRNTCIIGMVLAFALGLYCGIVFMQLGGASGEGGQGGAVAPHVAEALANEPRLREATVRDPGNARHWAELGNMYYDAHRPEQAIEAYTRSLAIDPGQTGVLVDLGAMYLSNGKPEEAIRRFDQALALDPRFQPALLNKGVAFIRWGQKDAARAVWLELLRVNPRAALPDGTPVGEALRAL